MNLKSLLMALLSLAFATPAGAAAPPDRTLSASAVLQYRAALEDGGDVAVSRSRLQGGGTLYRSRQLIANWSLEIGMTSYDFRGEAAEPWDEIYRIDSNLALVHPFNRQWSLLVIPGLSASGEAGAEVEKSLGYGLVTALNWSAGEQLRLGLGGAVYENLDEFQGFPLLLIDWQPAPGWRLANPLRAGITGPAGLELSWQFISDWTFAAGGAWRSQRFRLDDTGSVPGGVGEESLVPVWIRLTWQRERLQTSIYGGAALEGTLTREDRSGHDVRSEGYAATPFVGFYVSGSF